jgi:hypothetical protein
MSPASRIKRSIHCIGRLILAAVLVLPAAAQAETELEAKVKAAYLFHLTKFVDWPSLPPDALHICVLGNDPVGGLLLELSGRQVKEHVLKVDANVTGDLALCQVLFISRSEKQWGDILARVRGESVLTVSDHEDFARGGGVVGFYSDGGKIKLEINPVAARKANLRISAKLMEMSRNVPTP